jgi:Zn-dependent peptidase ImmA (M78 family)
MRIREAIQQHMMQYLLQLCQHELELDQLPPVEFVEQPYIEGGGKKTFGVFDGKSIKVVVLGRHPMDVARTLAHELTHWKQQTTGSDMDGSDGSDAENQANAVAGIIMRKFSEQYPDCFTSSLPS